MTTFGGIGFDPGRSKPRPPCRSRRRTTHRGFSPTRAGVRWLRAGLEQIGLHEERDTFASLMIAGGVNAKALSTYMGHWSVTITHERYGHLMPGKRERGGRAARRLLSQAVTAAGD
jgi:integrase